MTDEKDLENKKVKKLTLGSGKLTLGKGSSFQNRPRTGQSSVVVEIKRGKAVAGPLKLRRQDEDHAGNSLDENSLNLRRLSALRKSKDDAAAADKVSGLSKLAEINQQSRREAAQNTEEEVSDVEAVHEEDLQEEIKSADVPNEIAPVSASKIIAASRAAYAEANSARELAKENAKTASKESTKDSPKLFKKEGVIKGKEIDPAEDKKGEPTKIKVDDGRKLKKSDLIHMLAEDADEIPTRTRSLASIKRARAKEKRKQGVVVKDKVYREVIIPENITVGELASRMSERASDVIRELMKLDIMATTAQSIDADTAEIIVETLGHTGKRVKESDVEKSIEQTIDKEEDLTPRAPIVTVMGHVDHGKTSLLDALKSTDIAAGEAGGITQHVGAYSVVLSDDKMITFLDTPGHEAFTQMRTRGASVTDIVVLVVAADDGIKAQTIEAISHAKAAKVPIIVAINKIDKDGADIDKVKNELLSHELVPEDFGGDVMTVPVSAKEKINIDKLEETILLVAEMQELKSNKSAPASGVVIESRIEKGHGVVATMIIKRGTLRKKDLIVAGTTYGKIKRITNDKGRSLQEAGPARAVEVFGLATTPSAGDSFDVVQNDKQARDITEYRIRKIKQKQASAPKTSLEELFQRASSNSQITDIPIIIKADVHGSIEAIVSSLQKIKSDEVKLNILHTAVGAISESDISLAHASNAIVVGFNVRSTPNAANAADKDKIDVRYYSIIYNLIDDIKAVMSGMLKPIIREEYIGNVDIREVFNITKVGKIAGSYVTRGIIRRGAGMRLLRDNIVIHEGKLKTLKRFKDDVKEVREGYECGIAFENYDDIKVGDQVEVFEFVEEKKQL